MEKVLGKIDFLCFFNKKFYNFLTKTDMDLNIFQKNTYELGATNTIYVKKNAKKVQTKKNKIKKVLTKKKKKKKK